MELTKQQKRIRRQRRYRAKIKGTASCPRLSVFRSLKHTRAQLIDDQKGQTLLQVSDADMDQKGAKTEQAKAVGELLAKKAAAQKISEVIFDRSGYKYHGRIKALAEGARKGGLKF